ncbi:hypothetical protein ACLD3G_22350, partial [Salmonella sp. 741265099_HSA]
TSKRCPFTAPQQHSAGRFFFAAAPFPLEIESASVPDIVPDFHHFTPLRALVSPPRLPALCSGFHAPA